MTTHDAKMIRPRLSALLLYRRIWFAIIPAPLAFGLTLLAGVFPEPVERVYSRTIYPFLSEAIGRAAGLLPFSLSEVFIYIIIASVICYLVWEVKAVIKKPEVRGRLIMRLASTIVCALGIWYFLFVMMTGLNYHRQTFTEYSGLAVRDSSADELAALCGELVQTANALRHKMPEDGGGVMRTGFGSYYEQAAFAGGAFANLGDSYPILGGFAPRPKPVLMSWAMSHMNIVGVFIPFTYESNINIHVPDYNIPSSMMHELSHFKGFMREDEANFIAWMACRDSGSDEFAYSGAMLALIHSTNALYSADRDAYAMAMSGLNAGVRRDLAANGAYWRGFEGPVSEVSTAVNNTYLRANRQADGVKSYGRMVDLLLAEYRLRHGLD